MLVIGRTAALLLVVRKRSLIMFAGTIEMDQVSLSPLAKCLQA